MDKFKKRLSGVHHFIHKYFLWIVLTTYFFAAILPSFGLWIRDVSFGDLVWFDKSSVKLSLPLLMLSFLLFDGALGVKTKELKGLIKYPLLLFVGLFCNIFIPIVLIFILKYFMVFWHNPDEVQNILVGLAIVASMPIAGSSTAWSQITDGNLALSLGLVIFSTILSPFTTPLALHSVGFMASGDYGEDLHELAANGTSAFLMFSIIFPTIFGLFIKLLLGEKRAEAVKPFLKFINVIILILLMYSNAAVALPEAFLKPDLDFLLIIFIITTSLCIIAFGAGWLITKLMKAGKAEQSSLMFGLGMNNNGGALVLATMALKDHPMILIPIIFYNLAQQTIASIVNMKMFK